MIKDWVSVRTRRKFTLGSNKVLTLSGKSGKISFTEIGSLSALSRTQITNCTALRPNSLPRKYLRLLVSTSRISALFGSLKKTQLLKLSGSRTSRQANT
jgi:hypothetical protein